MPTLKIPKTEKPGAISLVGQGLKEAGRRVDFRPGELVIAIETKGYRLAWSRNTHCPCAPVNSQTDQSDPNCTLCGGTSWISFRPNNAVIDMRVVGALDALQLRILTETNASLIRGIMTGISMNASTWDKVGPRVEGVVSVTARSENKLGYYDRLINLDSQMVYSQVFNLEDPEARLPTRYFPSWVNHLRSLTKVFEQDVDYTVDNGDVTFIAGRAPDVGERLSIHYLCHPPWRVIEHPHSIRTTPLHKKRKEQTEFDLPVSGIAKLEFLP